MLLKDKIEIEKWLNKHYIEKYDLMSNEEYGYVVNVNGNVNLYNQKLNKIDIKFNIIKGDFDCSCNRLQSLVGCPEVINGEFNCGHNELESLQWCPEIVKGYFKCAYNKLKTLDFCPKIINGNFNCGYNQLESLKGCPEIVNGGFFCYNNNIDIDGLILMNALQVNGTKIDFTNNEKLKEIQNINNFNELKKIINIYKEKIKILNIIENKENQLINLNKKIIKI